ncbi:HNH endonuclease, partial [Planctomycetota bacterium]|nr:HNH endonuclease [Planctomycetota bacterium]
QHGIANPIDGVWNLVLACAECNRGEGGKFAKLPAERLLKRLSTRNEFLIGSHHPLRETLREQTGSTAANRAHFLDRTYKGALVLGHEWSPEPRAEATF